MPKNAPTTAVAAAGAAALAMIAAARLVVVAADLVVERAAHLAAEAILVVAAAPALLVLGPKATVRIRAGNAVAAVPMLAEAIATTAEARPLMTARLFQAA